ncbi:MAG: hypothetical protein QOF21_1135 [Actinomycetota bacterium]|jgi:uncharacterized protein (TIGR03086 family)
MEPLELYTNATDWAAEKVAGAAKRLEAPTPCDEWNVRTLVSHMIDTQNYFAGKARGQDVPLPKPMPPDLVRDDPLGAYNEAVADTLDAFNSPGGLEKAGIGVGIAFSDSMIHGWDVATATGQDATMPEGLAAAALEMIHGRFTPEQREGVFKPEVEVADDAPVQDKLLAYSGRTP